MNTSELNNYINQLGKSLQDTLSLIANNTAPDEFLKQDIDELNLWIAIIALIVGILGTWFGWLAYRFSKKTADNVVRMSANTQIAQLNDLIRHLYRNLVVTIAFTKRMSTTKEHVNYPSEIHLQKLKMLPDDAIHLEKYNDNTDVYKVMHELKLLLRNYDTEIDIAQIHLKDRNIENDVLTDDLNGLCYKPFHLINSIILVEQAMNKYARDTNENHYKDMILIILSEHFNKLANNIDHIEKWGQRYAFVNYCQDPETDCSRSFKELKKLEETFFQTCVDTQQFFHIQSEELFDTSNSYLQDKARKLMKSESQNLNKLWEITQNENLETMLKTEFIDFNALLPILISIDVAIEHDKIKLIKL